MLYSQLFTFPVYRFKKRITFKNVRKHPSRPPLRNEAEFQLVVMQSYHMIFVTMNPLNAVSWIWETLWGNRKVRQSPSLINRPNNFGVSDDQRLHGSRAYPNLCHLRQTNKSMEFGRAADGRPTVFDLIQTRETKKAVRDSGTAFRRSWLRSVNAMRPSVGRNHAERHASSQKRS